MSTIGFIDGMTTALIAEANYLLQNTFTKKGVSQDYYDEVKV